MADLGIQINARGSNVSAQRRANNVVIEIDNSETKAATEAALAAAASTQEIGEQVAQEAAEKIAEVDAALTLLQQIDAPARIVQLEAQLAEANSTIELITALYPISQFTALGNPVLADGNPLLAGA